MKLRVAPIAAEIHKADLAELFEEYGEVDEIHILRSQTRESIAMVDMFRDSEAEEAIDNLDETEIGGLVVRVEYWHDHAEKKGVPKPIVLDDDDDDDDDDEALDEIEVDDVDDGESEDED